MSIEVDDVTRAARLIQFGLRPRARPGLEPEYQSLLDRYFDRPDFRTAVEALVRGLELEIVDTGVHGIVLAPMPDSAFTPGSDDRRHQYADDRLIEGLIQVGIAAVLFPRPEDLAEESTIARPPITVDEIEETLRSMVSKLEEQARTSPDPATDEEDAGLTEAWRAYQQRAAARESRAGGKGGRTTRRLIELAFERLVDHGCFVPTDGGSKFHPTWRYQALVRDLAAMCLFERVQSALRGP